MTPKNKAVLSADASCRRAHPAAAMPVSTAAISSQGLMIVSAFAATLATAGCGAVPPVMSGWPGQDGAGMLAWRVDPYARAALAPAQWQRANTYREPFRAAGFRPARRVGPAGWPRSCLT